MVDWYYIFSILPLGVYPCSPDIYNVGSKTPWQLMGGGYGRTEIRVCNVLIIFQEFKDSLCHSFYFTDISMDLRERF
jgi:hypothetical protein